MVYVRVRAEISDICFIKIDLVFEVHIVSGEFELVCVSIGSIKPLKLVVGIYKGAG